jgi:hypothetical protein
MDTIDGSWRHVRAFLNPYNRMGDNIYDMAHSFFFFSCGLPIRERGPVTKFIGIVVSKDESVTPTLEYGNVTK